MGCDLKNMVWAFEWYLLLIYDQPERIREFEDKKVCLNKKNLEERFKNVMLKKRSITTF